MALRLRILAIIYNEERLMKKIKKFLSIIVLLFILSGCKSTKSVSNPKLAVPSDLSVITHDIGLTLNDLLLQHTSYKYLHLPGYDFSAECLGPADKSFAYVFFGTQGGPGLEEMADKYAEQMKCAGIYTTVGSVFSAVGDAPIPIETFMVSVGIKSIYSDELDFWNGWLLFEYSGYSIAINTNEYDNISSNKQSISEIKIKKDFSIIVIDNEYLSDNEKLCDKYAEEKLINSIIP